MNEAVYKRVRDRVKEYNLSEQEIRAIDKARREVNTHTTLGGFTGALAAFFLGKRKRFAPLQVFALAGGGFLIGSQMGLISGSLAGVRAIKELPDPQRLVNLVREVQKEMIQSRGQPSALPQAPQRTIDSGATQNDGVDNSYFNEFSLDEPEDHNRLSNEFESDKDAPEKQQELLNSVLQQQHQHQKPRQESAWDKIRAQNAPDNTWARLRMEAQKNPGGIDGRSQTRADVAKDLQERSKNEVDNLPRTREEVEHRHNGPVRTNRWGDPIE